MVEPSASCATFPFPPTTQLVTVPIELKVPISKFGLVRRFLTTETLSTRVSAEVFPSPISMNCNVVVVLLATNA